MVPEGMTESRVSRRVEFVRLMIQKPRAQPDFVLDEGESGFAFCLAKERVYTRR